MDVIGLPARAAEVWGCGRDATVNLRDGAAANGNRTKQREFPTSLRLLQLPNNAKTAISITKAVPTTANTKYISPGEDGATFMTCLAPYRIDCLTAEILKATKFWNPKFPQSSLKFSRSGQSSQAGISIKPPVFAVVQHAGASRRPGKVA